MQFLMHRDSFRTALALVSGAVAGKSTLPVLLNILIETNTDNGTIRFTATNLELAIIGSMAGKIESAGAITVPAKLLVDLVNNLPSEILSFQTTDHKIRIKCGKFDSEIIGIPADDYPTVPTVTNVGYAVDAVALRKALTQVVVACASDDSRPVLTSMRFHSADSQLSLCAADGFRLATVNIPIEEDATFHKLVPAKAIAQVIKALPSDGSIHIQIDVSFICFAMPHCTIVTRLIDGNYPDIERVIPKEHGCRTIVNKAALMRALKLSKLLNDIARLSIEETAIIVSSNNTERGNNKSTVDTLSTGEYHQIAVNVNYLTEALAAFDSEDVILETTSDKAPMVLKYPRASSDYTHIIMPMAIRN